MKISDDDSGAGPGRGSPTPRWMPVVGIVIAVVGVVLLVVLHLTGTLGPGAH